jgi:eukaryotic-like serine/threonine-protein kinase
MTGTSTAAESAGARRLGPYEIVRTLGTGGQGVVFDAVDLRSGERAALKTVPALRRRTIESLRREIQALASLRHPGVVRILDHGVEGGVPWYAMERIDGQPLSRLLRPPRDVPTGAVSTHETALAATVTGAQEASWAPRCGDGTAGDAPAVLPSPRPVPQMPLHPARLGEILDLTLRLCRALAYLHGEGLVHRDLKPGNVLVRPGGVPILVDFGLVSHFAAEESRETLDLTGVLSGTISYMAPEQVQGELVDARADLYALGCVLYELLSGRPPFVARSPRAVLEQHLGARPEALSERVDGVPPALEDLVMRLLAKRPRDRVGHADDVAGVLSGLGAELGEASAWPRARAYLYRPRFAGRDQPLRRLNELLALASSGRGALVLVGGESGAGKTRLSLEAARGAQRLGLRVLLGECPPGEPAPLQGFRHILQSLADLCRERGAETTQRLLGVRARALVPYEPGLAELCGQDAAPEPEDLPAAAARARLFAVLETTLQSLAEEKPLLLILDDLQWADDLTLGFLEDLLVRSVLGRLPAMIIGTYRSDEVRPELRRLLQQLPGGALLALGRIDAEAIGTIVGDMLALPSPPKVFAGFLAAHADGNPFFVAEYMRAALGAGLLYRDAQGRWHVADGGTGAGAEAVYAALPLPRSIRELVARRLDALAPDVRALAQVAAVLGRQTDSETLALAAGIEGPCFAEGVQELFRGQVLEESEDGGLRFVHDQIQEATYGRLEVELRRRLHRCAAEVIERLRAADDTAAAELARHWERAEEGARARGYYLKAAQRARGQHALTEAEELYRKYLELADAACEETVAARNELGAGVLATRGRTRDALDELQRALEEARAIGDRKGESRSLRALGAIHGALGHPDRHEELIGMALAVDRAAGDRHSEGISLSALATNHLGQDRLDESIAVCGQALELNRELGNREAEASCLNLLGNCRGRQGRPAESLELYGRALQLHRETGNRTSEGVALANMAIRYHELGRVEESHATYEAALAMFREVGHRRFEGHALAMTGQHRHAEGRLEEARTRLRQALKILREVGDRNWQAQVLCGLGMLEAGAGRFAEARELFEDALGLSRQVKDRRLEACALGHVAEIELAEGRPGQGRRLFRQAFRLQSTIGTHERDAATLLGLARLERRCGLGPERIGEWLSEAEARFRRSGEVSGLALCLCERGHLELAAGRGATSQRDEAARLAQSVHAGPGSELAQAVARLGRAVEAFENGLALVGGECAVDLPEGFLKWIELGRRQPRAGIGA